MADVQNPTAPAAKVQGPYAIMRYHRHWAVVDPTDELVCITVYKRGAVEVVRRLAG
ncbi:MAG TPA: hypothetical protein VE871_20400 [Longimicrobium sp.]|nr:hypothetical protein [Longimicrobium sp.]